MDRSLIWIGFHRGSYGPHTQCICHNLLSGTRSRDEPESTLTNHPRSPPANKNPHLLARGASSSFFSLPLRLANPAYGELFSTREISLQEREIFINKDDVTAHGCSRGNRTDGGLQCLLVVGSATPSSD